MKYYSRASRLTITLTVVYIMSLICFELWMFVHVQSSFLPAVINAIIFLVLAINLLSIPRFTRLSGSGIEVCCILDITHIPLDQIRRVRVVESGAMSWCVPLLGIYGLFGYYGWYFNLRRWRIFKCYTKSLRGSIIIERSVGRDIIISVDDRDSFVKGVRDLSIEVE